MSHDLLMLRGEQDGGYNLAVGEPVFLQQDAFWCAPRALMPGDVTYPAYGGDATLIDTIRKALKHSKKHIVVANGAKQALLAAFYAYKSRTYRPKTAVACSSPYWPSYPTLATLSGLKFIDTTDTPLVDGWRLHPSDDWGRAITVATSPNNPDGSETVRKVDVWDAAYGHWLYGAKGAPQCDVSVWSAAKLLGLSGLRIGVLTTDDADLAEYARMYVEKTTSGVSNESQHRLHSVLQAMLASKDQVAATYAEARRVLLRNGEVFNKHLSRFCSEVAGLPVSGRGMFAWFKCDHARMYWAGQKANVKLIPGVACGVKGPYEIGQNGCGWWRMSMGHRNQYTEQACEALVKVFDQ